MLDNPKKFQERMGLTDFQMSRLEPLLEEMDRNARAFGWEIGNGKSIDDVIESTSENPFLDPNWREA